MTKNRWIKLILALCAALALIVGLYSLGRKIETSGYTSSRGTQEADFAALKRVEYNSKRYVRKDSVTTVLLMGIDKEAGAAAGNYRRGGQADFIMVLVIDDAAKTVSRLQIDRDTMANITVLGVLGQNVGTRYTQICLSHGFGITPEQNCEYAREAVQNFLQGERIDLYAALDLDSIALINDMLGGVEVTVQDDMSSIDPALVSGARLALTGKQAEYFVRSRYNVADGTNEARMLRQKTYIDAATQVFMNKAKTETDFAGEAYEALSEYMTTDISKGRMINEVSRAAAYEWKPIVRLDCAYTVGSDGYTECRVTEETVVDWVLGTLYTQQ